jgi:riboflavin transporter FmnP
MREKFLTTKNVVLMAMFGALGAVLMMFEFPLLFIAPSFYKLDLSEVPVLVGSFALGPVAGVVIEIVKILIKLVIKPTSTGFVGEFANVVVGCAFVVPAGVIYRMHKHKTKKQAVLGMAVGTLVMAAVGIVVNALIMIPFYSNFMPIGPFNIVKGIIVSAITALVYKRISILIHTAAAPQAYGQRV